MPLVWVYLGMVVGGVIMEVMLSKVFRYITGEKLHKKHFSIGRYLYLLIFPLLGTLLVYQLKGISIIKIFLVFAFAGPIFEWCVGYAYYQVMGTHLWLYRKFSINGHTSLLTFPLWGMAGVLFWLITQKFA